MFYPTVLLKLYLIQKSQNRRKKTPTFRGGSRFDSFSNFNGLPLGNRRQIWTVTEIRNWMAHAKIIALCQGSNFSSETSNNATRTCETLMLNGGFAAGFQPYHAWLMTVKNWVIILFNIIIYRSWQHSAVTFTRSITSNFLGCCSTSSISWKLIKALTF